MAHNKSLTERFINQVTVTKRVEFPDAGKGGVPQLWLCVYPSGVRTWRLRYSSPELLDARGQKKQTRYTLGQYPGMALNKARSEARRLLGVIDGGKDPAKADDDAVAVITVRELYVRYYDQHIATKSVSHKTETARIFETRVLPEIGSMRVDKLTDRKVVKIWEGAEKSARLKNPDNPNAGKSMAALVCRTLRTFFKRCLRAGWIDTNPIRDRSYEYASPSRERYLTLAEIGKFWRWLESSTLEPKTKDLLKLRLLTGQRTQEMTRAKVAHFDLKQGLWTIPSENAKNRTTHVVPLGALAIDILRNAITAYKENRLDSDLMFPAKPRNDVTKGKVAAQTNRNIIGRAVLRNLDVMGFADNPFRPHDLRRTAATNLAENDILPHVIEALLNHKTGEVKGVGAVYNRAKMLPQMRFAIDTWNTMILEAAEIKISERTAGQKNMLPFVIKNDLKAGKTDRLIEVLRGGDVQQKVLDLVADMLEAESGNRFNLMTVQGGARSIEEIPAWVTTGRYVDTQISIGETKTTAIGNAAHEFGVSETTIEKRLANYNDDGHTQLQENKG